MKARGVAALVGSWLLASAVRADTIEALAVSADGKLVAACGGENEVWMCELATGKQLHAVKLELRPESLALSPDGKTLAVGAADASGHVVLIDVAGGKVRATVPIGDLPATTLAFTKDGKHLLAGGMSGLLTLFEADDLSVVRDYKGEVESNVNWVAIAPDGKTFAAANVDHAIRIYELESGKLLATFSGHEDSVDQVEWSPDGKAAISVDASGKIKLWDPATAKETGTISAGDYATRAVALSPDGKTIAWAGEWGRIHIQDRTTLAEKGTLPGKDNMVKRLVFTPDGKSLVVGDLGGVVRALAFEDLLRAIELAAKSERVLRQKAE